MKKDWEAVGKFEGFGVKTSGGIKYTDKKSNGSSGPITGARSKKDLSPCAREYAAALANPFDTGPVACIPDFPVLLTRKAKYFAKGNFQTGTGGFGFVTMTPEYFTSDAPVAGASLVRFTDATYAATMVTIIGGGVNAGLSNSDYAAATFGAAAVLAEYRVVSAGLRVRYAGTELNRGGDMFALHEPNHQSLAGATSTVMRGYLESITCPVVRTWTNVLYKPVLLTDTQYKNTFPTMTTTNVDFNNYMCIAVQAADALVSLNFDWEAYVNVELNGRNIQGRTPSLYDPVGFAAVQNEALLTLRPTQGNFLGYAG